MRKPKISADQEPVNTTTTIHDILQECHVDYPMTGTPVVSCKKGRRNNAKSRAVSKTKIPLP